MTGGPADPTRTAFLARSLSYRYPGAQSDAVSDLDLQVRRGELFAILGPNGSGKSTLLRILLGALTPASGQVEYAGVPIGGWDPRDFARKVGVVPQIEESPFPITVREMVGMGRYPHLGPWRSESAADRAAVASAMEQADVVEFASREFATLSGGERQRARIARALAQEPETLVLDEPSAALDVRHEMGIFELLRHLAMTGVTVVLVTHNLNLAARFADRVVLMDAGVGAGTGSPAEVLTRPRIEGVYQWPVAVTPYPGPGSDTGSPQVSPLSKGFTG